MADPLAQFRKKPIVRHGGEPPRRSAEPYEAFNAKDKVERLRIRRASDPTRAPGYAYLLDVVYDGSFGTNFVLVYTFMMVLVRGSNLLPVVTALEMGTAEFLQEFDPDRWDLPDPKAPFIESIEVVVQEGASPPPGQEKPRETKH